MVEEEKPKKGGLGAMDKNDSDDRVTIQGSPPVSDSGDHNHSDGHTLSVEPKKLEKPEE